MVSRLTTLNQNNSLFLFGARGTGKTTLLKQVYQNRSKVLWIDLLTEQDEETYSRHPGMLSQVLSATKYSHVVIDEIQKVPKLLDIVQKEIVESKTVFILSGSSARKLKRGSGNLLGGRAFQYLLYPLTSFELKEHFDLNTALHWGSLPNLLELNSDESKARYLKSYVKTYLKEEIISEQIVRNVPPFRDFLEISAQMNGQIINFSKIASDIGVDDKTVKQYFEILEDTLLGFYLNPFHRSIRKRQRESPKFYLFDTGVKRAMEGSLNSHLRPQTSAYGDAFEHFVILELVRLNEYYQKDLKISYLKTKDDAEIDLIVECYGEKDKLIEIKSAQLIKDSMTGTLQKFQKDWDRPCEAQVWSQDETHKKIGVVSCLNWQKALKNLFNKSKG